MDLRGHPHGHLEGFRWVSMATSSDPYVISADLHGHLGRSRTIFCGADERTFAVKKTKREQRNPLQSDNTTQQTKQKEQSDKTTYQPTQ